MKTSSYFVVLALTIVVGCIAAVGARIAEREGSAAFARLRLWTETTPSISASKPPEEAAATKAEAPAQPPAIQPEPPRDYDDPTPILPKEIAAVVGQRFVIYFDNLVIARDPDRYVFEIETPTLKGASDRRFWSTKPTKAEAGRHNVLVRVKALTDGRTLAEGTTTIVVVDPETVNVGSINLLIVGASNTHQGILPNDIWTRLNAWKPGQVTFVGSPTAPTGGNFSFYRPTLPGVLHEGLGGWAWENFASHYMPGKESLYKLPKSPFVFLENGKSTLDVGRYLDEKNVRGRLNAVMFDLGINETFGANPDDPASLKASLDAALKSADKLISAFKLAAPEAKIIVGMPAPFTRSGPVFEKRYGAANPAFGDPMRHRRIVLALARRMIEHFSNSETAVVLAPLYLSIDVIDGYWQIDPGHPNELGADQMAAVFQAALVRALAGN